MQNTPFRKRDGAYFLSLALLALAVVLWSSGPARAQDQVAGETRRSIDAEIQQVKKEAVDLNRELARLEQELLFPANTQVAVFLSMNVGALFPLDSVQLKVDGVEVASHIYSAREAEALSKGGVQRLYLGNVRTGEHELLAIFTGGGSNGSEYRRGGSIQFVKKVAAKYLELRINDRQRSGQPEFEIKDWE